MDSRLFNVAVVGATGLVGETLSQILAERQFPVDNFYALASANSKGKRVAFGDRMVAVDDLATFDFRQADIALFSAGGAVSREYAPRAAEAGCVVVDNTSEFRYDDDIPLVVSEVNPDALENWSDRRIIANPNCSTMQMMVALKPLQDLAGIRRIDVCTYQSVSGAGRKGIEQLAGQTAALLNGRDLELGENEPRIAFNVWPHIDEFQDNRYSREEMKMVWESQKILDDPSIIVNPTAVRVPVFYAHSEAVSIEFKRKISADEALEVLRQAPGIEVMDDTVFGGYPSPAVCGTGTDGVYVGRVREWLDGGPGLNLWIVSDNVRKGAELNSVQIAEILVKDYL
ncbi:MAG: aspartate-semialdehyde dehydrogenase [Gammaproteobacteria bacterium]